MTNREYMIALLQSTDEVNTYQYFFRNLGCGHIPAEECIKRATCDECWKHWLESEVDNNDHA